MRTLFFGSTIRSVIQHAILLLHSGGDIYGDPVATVVRHGASGSMFHPEDNQAPGTVVAGTGTGTGTRAGREWGR